MAAKEEGRSPLVLAIVGARTFDDWPQFCLRMNAFVVKYGEPTCVVSGGACGADTMGARWARARKVELRVFRPRWKRPDGSYDRGAGLARNGDIVAACTHMIAFPTAKGKGTQDSIKKAKAAGKVVEVHWI